MAFLHMSISVDPSATDKIYINLLDNWSHWQSKEWYFIYIMESVVCTETDKADLGCYKMGAAGVF